MEIDQDKIEELGESILKNGLLQPILVRPVGDRFEVVAGDRRFKAHQLKGINRIPAISREMSDEDAAILRATENLEREDLTPLEEARTYARLNEKHGMSWEEIGKRTGKSPGWSSVELIFSGCPNVYKGNSTETCSIGVAEELWRIQDPTGLEYYLSFAVDNGRRLVLGCA